MKYFKLLLMIILCQQMGGCTISHDFGPYQGKVVDKETLKPIQGAVVFIKFYTEFGYSPGGAVSYFADAVETLTDKNGEFSIPVHKVTLFKLFHGWEEFGHIIIFKPGYGAFPRHKDSSPKPSPFYTKSQQKYVTIQLPKLHTNEERKWNIPDPGMDVPDYKKINLLRLECIEDKSIGLPPEIDCCEDDK